MAVLTLHQGENQQEYVEHPIEVARRALREAALLEEIKNTDSGDNWAGLLRRSASSLPERRPIPARGGEPVFDDPADQAMWERLKARATRGDA